MSVYPEELWLSGNLGLENKRTVRYDARFISRGQQPGPTQRPNYNVPLSEWIQIRLDEGDIVINNLNETNTTLILNGDILEYTNELSNNASIDLSKYLDNVNVVSGVENSGTLTLTLSNGNTVDIDLSTLVDGLYTAGNGLNEDTPGTFAWGNILVDDILIDGDTNQFKIDFLNLSEFNTTSDIITETSLTSSDYNSPIITIDSTAEFYLKTPIHATRPTGSLLQLITNAGRAEYSTYAFPTGPGADNQILVYDLATNALVFEDQPTIPPGSVYLPGSGITEDPSGTFNWNDEITEDVEITGAGTYDIQFNNINFFGVQSTASITLDAVTDLNLNGDNQLNLNSPQIDIVQKPTLNNLATDLLVRNPTTGTLEYRDVSTITGTGGSGEEYHRKTITQVAHGFSIPAYGFLPLHLDKASGLWVAASSASEILPHETFLVEIVDTDTFIVQQSGYLNTGAHGLSKGDYYFLTDAGNISLTADADIDDVVCHVPDTTSVMLLNQRPFSPSAGGGGAGDYISNVTLLPGNILDFTKVGLAFGGTVDLSSIDSYISNITWNAGSEQLEFTAVGSAHSTAVSIPLPQFGITIEDDGTPLAGTPHTIFDFVGDGIDVINNGGGQVTITSKNLATDDLVQDITTPGPTRTYDANGGNLTFTGGNQYRFETAFMEIEIAGDSGAPGEFLGYDAVTGVSWQTPSGTGGDPDQNLWETITADTGSTVASTTTDTLTIAGGTDISTSIVGDVLTINYTGAGGAVYTSNNAITKTTNNFQLGGQLVKDTEIDGEDNYMDFVDVKRFLVQANGVRGAAVSDGIISLGESVLPKNPHISSSYGFVIGGGTVRDEVGGDGKYSGEQYVSTIGVGDIAEGTATEMSFGLLDQNKTQGNSYAVEVDADYGVRIIKGDIASGSSYRFPLQATSLTVAENKVIKITSSSGTDVFTEFASVAYPFTPTNSVDTSGDEGDIAYDSTYIYYKDAVGWKRIAGNTF